VRARQARPRPYHESSSQVRLKPSPGALISLAAGACRSDQGGYYLIGAGHFHTSWLWIGMIGREISLHGFHTSLSALLFASKRDIVAYDVRSQSNNTVSPGSSG
jgi:hypothetical protein